MEKMTKVFETEVTIKTKRKIETEEIANTDFVYYRDYKSVISTENPGREIRVNIGITSKANLLTVKGLEPIQDVVSAPKMFESKAQVVAIRNENYAALINGKKHLSYVVEQLDESNVYGRDTKNYKLVLYNWECYRIADLQHNLISIPITMSYIDGQISNREYDLEKLLEKLKKDPNVLDRENLHISNIPYYNCEEDKTQTINFQYLLPTEIYEKVMTTCKNKFQQFQYILSNVIGANECLKENIYERTKEKEKALCYMK